MAVKMRLQRKGRKQAPYYHIVIADARAPRDGRYIERLGFYNPMTKPATIEIDRDRAYEWITMGAQPTDTVRAILRFKGVLMKKHLMRGVKKGAMSVEEAEAKLQDWINTKEGRIAARVQQTQVEQEERRKAIFGQSKQAPVVEEQAPVAEEQAPVAETPAAVVETPEIAAEEVAQAVEETPVVAEDPTPAASSEETPAEEPAVTAEEPAVTAEEPAVTAEEPAVKAEEPAVEASEEETPTADAENTEENKEEA
jgi:small subunit ribosomal protein S16